MTIPSPDRLKELRNNLLSELVDYGNARYDLGRLFNDPHTVTQTDAVNRRADAAWEQFLALLDSHLAGAGATPKCDHMGCAVNTHLGSPTGECTRCGETFALQTYESTPPPAADQVLVIRDNHFITGEGDDTYCNSHGRLYSECVKLGAPPPPQPAPSKMSFDELQRILEREDETPIQILPNGEIRQGGEPTEKKPLTMRENLGGEHAPQPASGIIAGLRKLIGGSHHAWDLPEVRQAVYDAISTLSAQQPASQVLPSLRDVYGAIEYIYLAHFESDGTHEVSVRNYCREARYALGMYERAISALSATPARGEPLSDELRAAMRAGAEALRTTADVTPDREKRSRLAAYDAATTLEDAADVAAPPTQDAAGGK